MKFAKQLETEAEDIPSEWRPYLIQYKALKKLVTKVAEEIESRGLSTSLLHECLDGEGSDIPKIRYYFTGEAPDIKPNIEFTYDTQAPQVQQVLSKMLLSDNQETPKLEYKKSHENKDFFALATTTATTTDDHHGRQVITTPETKRRNSTVSLVKELLNLTLQENQPAIESSKKGELKSIVIELEQDDEFFKMLMQELAEAAMLQDVTKQKFDHDISNLEGRMTKVASPTQKTDMYNWRRIFAIYMDAQIFRGNTESDKSFRTVERARKQMTWFLTQLEKANLLNKLKSRESKSAFEQFISLNTELITIKHYQLLNETAMRKILKKHDKRSGLTASENFPKFVSTDDLFSPQLASMLYATITSKLTTIIPQPDDYACPVCMSVAWRPIRLSCNHVFCVRCLIKAQKKGMTSCPLCRHPTAVGSATALNLDEGLQNFLKMYFPQEIKQKKRENEREQAIEDVQAMTGKLYTEEQLIRMNKPSDTKCVIM